MLPASALVLQGNAQINAELAREETFSDIDYALGPNEFRDYWSDPNYMANYTSMKNGQHKVGNRYLSLFSDGTYGVRYTNDPYHNYYYSETRDLLITRVLAPSAGLDNPILNVGKMRNCGIEIELNWADRVKDFGYSIGFNLTTTKNKVLELANEGQTIYGEGLKYGTEHFPTQTRVGYPIGAFYLYQTDGIFQSDAEAEAYVNKDGERLQPNAKAGDIRFKDVNGNGEIDEGDKVYSGSGIPALEANLSFSADYKGFDLSLLLGSAWNYKLYNGNKYYYEGMNSSTNMLKSTLDAWTPTNTDTDVPRAVYQDPNGNMKESDRYLENGNFVRLRQLQLGYTLPANLTKKIYVEKLRLFVSGENLFTITGYDGIDPEFSRDNVLNAGIDNMIYPFTRSFTVGAQLTF